MSGQCVRERDGPPVVLQDTFVIKEEDNYIYMAIFDGHGGDLAALFGLNLILIPQAMM